MSNIRQWFINANQYGIKFKHILLLTLLSIMSTLSEVIGIGMFLPIFEYMKDKNESGKVVSIISDLLGHLNIEVTLVIMLSIAWFLFILRQLFVYYKSVKISKFSNDIVRNIRGRLFSMYLYSNQDYHDNMNVGNFSNLVSHETKGAVSGLISPIEIGATLITIFGSFILLIILSVEMTIAIFILIFLIRILLEKWMSATVAFSRKITEANSRTSAFLVDRIKSSKLVKLSNSYNNEVDMFGKLIDSQKKNTIIIQKLKIKVGSFLEPSLISISLLGLYISNAHLDMSVEIIALYFVVLLRVTPIVKQLINQIQGIKSNFGAIEVISDRISEMKAAKESNITGIDFDKLVEQITFDNVGFKYAVNSEFSLKNISFSVKKNTVTTIIGPSGSGKSTIIDLLLELRTATTGSISIDGINIEDYNLHSLRNGISYVPQDPNIFNTTIYQHIKYGNKSATREDVVSAAKMSLSHNFIMNLPDQYDQNMGESAVILSGGQRQRIDIARSLVSEASVLVLDEPTSSLDKKLERDFFNMLHSIKTERCIAIIIVTHKLESIKHSDQIIVLNKGNIELIGSHNEISKIDGWYKKMLHN
jgi:ABC-type multidrug transport system fused ATPase/permease subunit